MSCSCLMVSAFFTRRWPVSGNEALDHTPSRHWKLPEPKLDIQPGQGPVMIRISYQVRPACRAEFLQIMAQLGKARRRDGAWDWNVMENIGKPNTFQEHYQVASWLDHLRQHERISKQDAMVQRKIQELLAPDTCPTINHYIRSVH